jgi:fatty acid-binding protein DegV
MPQPVAIVSDSSADLPPPEIAKRTITLAPIQIALSHAYFRDDVLPRTDFYRHLPDEPRLPTIVAPLAPDFVAAYRTAAHYGEQILCLINPFESCSTYRSHRLSHQL